MDILSNAISRIYFVDHSKEESVISKSRGYHFQKIEKAVIFNLRLTHDGDGDGIRHLVPLHVAGLAGVAAGLPTGHLLQDQAVIGDDDPVVLVV